MKRSFHRLLPPFHFVAKPTQEKMMSRCSIVPSPNEVQIFRSLSGIQPLAESRRFKAWFLDQFGVLHDGKNPYPGAITALEKPVVNGAKMVIISNSSRHASVTMEKMKNLGFDPSLFVGAITSGELTHQYLQRRDDAWFAALGKSCIHMTWSDRGAISLEGLGLRVVDNAEEADFILAHGTEALGQPSGSSCPMKLEDLEKILELCVIKRIPMVVANPDFVTVEARALRVMPGTLAAKYEEIGGEVKWMGKPGKIIYEEAMKMAGVAAADVIAVGDSFHHDIKGTNSAGIESAFISCGIHSAELGLNSFGEVPEIPRVQALASNFDARPSYVLPAFTWLEGKVAVMTDIATGIGEHMKERSYIDNQESMNSPCLYVTYTTLFAGNIGKPVFLGTRPGTVETVEGNFLCTTYLPI